MRQDSIPNLSLDYMNQIRHILEAVSILFSIMTLTTFSSIAIG